MPIMSCCLENGFCGRNLRRERERAEKGIVNKVMATCEHIF